MYMYVGYIVYVYAYAHLQLYNEIIAIIIESTVTIPQTEVSSTS